MKSDRIVDLFYYYCFKIPTIFDFVARLLEAISIDLLHREFTTSPSRI